MLSPSVAGPFSSSQTARPGAMRRSNSASESTSPGACRGQTRPSATNNRCARFRSQPHASVPSATWVMDRRCGRSSAPRSRARRAGSRPHSRARGPSPARLAPRRPRGGRDAPARHQLLRGLQEPIRDEPLAPPAAQALHLRPGRLPGRPRDRAPGAVAARSAPSRKRPARDAPEGRGLNA